MTQHVVGLGVGAVWTGRPWPGPPAGGLEAPTEAEAPETDPPASEGAVGGGGGAPQVERIVVRTQHPIGVDGDQRVAVVPRPEEGDGSVAVPQPAQDLGGGGGQVEPQAAGRAGLSGVPGLRHR